MVDEYPTIVSRTCLANLHPRTRIACRVCTGHVTHHTACEDVIDISRLDEHSGVLHIIVERTTEGTTQVWVTLDDHVGALVDNTIVTTTNNIEYRLLTLEGKV